MARVKKAVGVLRARIANCSVKAAFALYAAIAIIAAIALTAIFSVVASLVAESTVEEDSDAYSGTFVFDEASNSLVPAETLSWYEAPAFESLYGQDGTEAPEGESAGTGAVILYVEGSSRADSKPIPLGNPPATVLDSTILDALWMAGASDVHDDSLSFSEIAAYAAALTSCPWWKIAAITTIGRIPSVASSTLAAGFAAEGNWILAAITFAVAAALAIAGGALYARRRSGHEAHPHRSSRRSSQAGEDAGSSPTSATLRLPWDSTAPEDNGGSRPK